MVKHFLPLVGYPEINICQTNLKIVRVLNKARFITEYIYTGFKLCYLRTPGRYDNGRIIVLVVFIIVYCDTV